MRYAWREVKPKEQPTIAVWRRNHHRIAELVAMGYTGKYIKGLVGYTPYYHDPTFMELVAFYRERHRRGIKPVPNITSWCFPWAPMDWTDPNVHHTIREYELRRGDH